MNVIEIEENVEQLAKEGFKPADFIYDFIAAYDAPKAILKQLRQGQQNPSEIGGILWRRYMHYKGASKGAVSATIDELQIAKENSKHKVRYIISTDGDQFAARDLKSGETLNCEFSKLGDHFGFFLPLANIERYKIADENPVDIKATGRLAKFYDSILEDNPSWRADEKRHTLNHFMTQIVFCLFAEDTGIFPQGIFSETLKTYCETDTTQTQSVLTHVFRAMSLADGERDELPAYAKRFPYVNGGLFNETIEVPRFLRGSVRYLLDAAMLDWRQINPDIFGSMIQSIVNEDQRGQLGMHYTSVPNILKVLDPLFLDDLRDMAKVNWGSKKGLHSVLKRISQIRVFDPACGSGNFLVIAYRELRSIEIMIMNRLAEIDNYTPPLWSNVELTNFFGIEYADFAAETARLSLWIAEYQMNSRYKDEFGQRTPALPLKSTGHIACGNALRIEWHTVCPRHSDPSYETYIVGNPPYLGSSEQNEEQKLDMETAFRDEEGWKSLDYVSGWFIKAAHYSGDNAAFAFVSTNSICQGIHVQLLWTTMLRLGVSIFFAHQSFKWSNNAHNNATVTCVIIGCRKNPKGSRSLYSGTTVQRVENISPYLLAGRNIIVEQSTQPLFALTRMDYGSKPVDGGHLVLDEDERRQLVYDCPEAEQFIRRYYGSREHLDGIVRYCLWITDEKRDLAESIPSIQKRLDLVREMRASSKKEPTRELAKNPHRFAEIRARNPLKTIIVPIHTSENRRYIPIGMGQDGSIASNAVFCLVDPAMWEFSLLGSRLHRIWIETTCGKLETRIRYSNTLGWNTFPVPELSATQKHALIETAQDILLARDGYFDKTISELYDPEVMETNFPELWRAHLRNDDVLESAYNGRPFRSDAERLEHLFARYSERVEKRN